MDSWTVQKMIQYVDQYYCPTKIGNNDHSYHNYSNIFESYIGSIVHTIMIIQYCLDKSFHGFIELDDGKIYRKALYLMVKTMVSCRFSLKPIQ